jgi:hypothetical protein
MPQKKPKTNKQKTAAKAKTEERETRREVSKQLKAQAPAQPVIPVPPLLPLAIPEVQHYVPPLPEVINEPEAEMPADPQNIVVIQPPAVTEWAREFARIIHYHEPLNTHTANAIEVFR